VRLCVIAATKIFVMIHKYSQVTSGTFFHVLDKKESQNIRSALRYNRSTETEKLNIGGASSSGRRHVSSWMFSPVAPTLMTSFCPPTGHFVHRQPS
jgi:hypothetical protein